MRKILVIAAREYKAAVRTKSFIVTLLLLPVLMGGSVAVQILFKRQSDTEDKNFAVVDRTPGGKLFPVLEEAAKVRNEEEVYDQETHKQIKPKFHLEKTQPSADSKEAIDLQRLELSERALKGDILGFVDIGPDVTKLRPSLAMLTGVPKFTPEEKERIYVRYQTNRPTYDAFPSWLRTQVLLATFDPSKEQERFQNTVQQLLALKTQGLSKRDPKTGAIIDPPLVHLIARYMVPAGLVTLMFMVILLASTPGMQGVVEEKMQRIAEVLLGSVAPFQLMLGKLLGLMGVSLTVAAAYLGCAYWAAVHYDFAEFLSWDVLAWFLLYQVLAVMMYGSIYLAIGAAVSDIKESQTLVLPVTMVACIPMFVLGMALEDPNNALVTGLSFFPPVTPMLMITRQSIPPGIPWWQPVVAVALVIVTTLLCVYAAGRIFRVGILMQGKGARMSDLVRWVVSG